MKGYERPCVLVTYSIDDLCTDAASCAVYRLSDVRLKTDIERVEQPLESLGTISS